MGVRKLSSPSLRYRGLFLERPLKKSKTRPLPPIFYLITVFNMAISRIYMICNAYESGVGHGVKDDKLPNPFEKDTFEQHYDAGSQKWVKSKEKRYGYGLLTLSQLRF